MGWVREVGNQEKACMKLDVGTMSSWATGWENWKEPEQNE